jgi:iron complex transport system ATP-binding protein
MTRDTVTCQVLLDTDALRIRIGDVSVTGDLNLRIEPGQCWCLLGRNGAGKTTLLKTLAGLRRPDGGRIRLLGRSLDDWSRRDIARHIGLLFQDHQDALPATVLETALTGRHPHLHAWQWETAADVEAARAALAQVGLSAFAERRIDTLSGGERRRVGIATLLAQAPSLYLLDEPANHLDLHHQTELLHGLRRSIPARGGALFMSLHDVNLAARLADHCLLLLGDGQTVAGPTGDVLTLPVLERLYEQKLEQLTSRHGPVWLPA